MTLRRPIARTLLCLGWLGSSGADAATLYQPGQSLAPQANPVVASVDGRLIHLSDIAAAIQTLPPDTRRLPFETLFPLLRDGLIAHAALALQAERLRLDQDPKIRAEMQAAADRVLERALLAREAAASVSPAALHAAYDRLFGSRPQVEEAEVELMLLPTQDDAVRVGRSLQEGGSFADLARAESLDRSRDRDGMLGFVRQDQLPPCIAQQVMAAAPGQVVMAPSTTVIGWYLARVGAHRQVPTPSFEAMRATLRGIVLREAAARAVKSAREQAVVHKFNLDGSAADAVPTAAASD